MQGAGSGPMRGIIPRAMEQVAAYCAQQRTRGWAYEMEVTYVEIYNEQVRDLLGEDAGAPTTRDFGRAERPSKLRRTPCFDATQLVRILRLPLPQTCVPSIAAMQRRASVAPMKLTNANPVWPRVRLFTGMYT